VTSLLVGIGDCKVSDDPDEVLVTHALGSCIALLIHDPVAKVAGLLHYVLPESSLDPKRAMSRPYVFADTGIPLLFSDACRLGAVTSRLIVMAVGGAQMLDANETFNIGRRNHVALHEILREAGIALHHEQIGGSSSRTVKIEVANGRIHLRVHGQTERIIVARPSRKTSSHA
jgi:chemotaxis protein CheD